MAIKHPRGALPPALSAKLSSLRAKLESEPTDRELNDVLDGLSSLSPNQVVRVSREIATTAGLDWFQPQRIRLARLMGKSLSEQDLMKKNPDYAWLFLFHGNGYVREAALDAIRTAPASPFFLAALAWRLNDWVWQVRQAARDCAQRVLPLIDAETAAGAALYLLGRRHAWGRWGDEADVLDAAFSRTDVIAALAVHLRQRSTGGLANGLRHALQYPTIDPHLPALAADAVQPAIRAIAYRCLMTRRATWPVGHEWIWVDKVYGSRKLVAKTHSRPIESAPPLAELMRQAVQDKSAKVRTVAADVLIETRAQIPDAESHIARLATDRSAAVRSRADYMLRHPTTHPT